MHHGENAASVIWRVATRVHQGETCCAARCATGVEVRGRQIERAVTTRPAAPIRLPAARVPQRHKDHAHVGGSAFYARCAMRSDANQLPAGPTGRPAAVPDRHRSKGSSLTSRDTTSQLGNHFAVQPPPRRISSLLRSYEKDLTSVDNAFERILQLRARQCPPIPGLVVVYDIKHAIDAIDAFIA